MILGGEVSGPLLSGEVLPGKIEWQADPAAQITQMHARYALRGADGRLVHVVDRGVFADNISPMAAARSHTAPEFKMDDDADSWVNQSIFIGVLDTAALDRGSVTLHVLRIV
jgi:hypothetical protein